MEKKCEIVRDLLFCYNDGVASNSSKELVENHLQNCEECKQALAEIKKDRRQQENKEEINYLKKINRKMKRKTIMMIISAVILGIFVIGNLYVLISYYQEGNLINIYLSDEITLEQLTNLIQTLEKKCGKNRISYTSKEDALNQVKEMFKDKKELLNTYQEENPFKSSIVIKSNEKEEEEIIQILNELEGIDNITTNTIDNPYLWFIGKILKNISEK